MPRKSKNIRYVRRQRRSVMYTARRFNPTHSCGGCRWEQDEICTLHENIPAFEIKSSGISTKYCHICPDWEGKSNVNEFGGDVVGVMERESS